MFAISVIICSHNPREDYLRRTLDGLKAQTLPLKDWELLLVDNASKEPLAKRFDLSWHPNGRHIREEKIGLTFARLRGIAESKGDLLIFVDDDNVLRADYLQNALKISSGFSHLGAWGGSYIPEFENEPPVELSPFLHGLVTDRIDTPLWAKITRGSLALPTGAGMVVRRKVATHYRELVLKDPMRMSLGRSGGKLSAGEDSDMALCGFELNLGAGRFPELELIHLIPAQRLTLKYFERLYEGFAYSGIILKVIHSRHDAFREKHGGQFKPSTLKRFFLWLFMIVTRKSRAERRIKMAEERGRIEALRDLRRTGFSGALPYF